MTKKDNPFNWDEEIEEKAPESVQGIKPAEEKYYESIIWKDVIPTFKCLFCGSCEPIEDNIKLHVLKHFPENKREDLLNKLTKE
jgi:hypothetical protein